MKLFFNPQCFFEILDSGLVLSPTTAVVSYGMQGGEVKTLPAGPAFIPLSAPTAQHHHHPSLRVAAAAQQQQAYGGRQHYQQKYQNANSYYNR